MNIPIIDWDKDVFGLYMSYNWITSDAVNHFYNTGLLTFNIIQTAAIQ